MIIAQCYRRGWTHPNKEQWKYVTLEPIMFRGGGTPASAVIVLWDFLYESYRSTKHNNSPGMTMSPSPSIEKWPELCMLGNTNFPGKLSFGGSRTIPLRLSFRATIPTGFSAGRVATLTITFVLKMYDEKKTQKTS